MALFRRRKHSDQPNLPEEVQSYYQSERQQKRGVAFLLAAITVVITIFLALALYFGGRFVYNAFFGGETTTSTEEVEEITEEPADSDPSMPGSGQNSEEEPDINGSVTPDQPANEDITEDSQEDQNQAQDTQADDQSTQQEIPTAGADEDALPSTGPADTVAAFLAVSLLAGLLHRFVTAKS